MLHALCKGLPAHFSSAFDLVCSLPPLPLCRGVSDKTHVSFRTRSAAAAERSKKHTKSSEVPAPPYCSRKVGFPRQFGGQGGKRRSAASGGKSEALSRQRRDWRARRSAGIALPQRWISPHGLGVPKGIFSSTKRISPLLCRAALGAEFSKNFALVAQERATNAPVRPILGSTSQKAFPERRAMPENKTSAAARRPTSNTSGNTTSRTTFRSPRRRSTVRWTPCGASA